MSKLIIVDTKNSIYGSACGLWQYDYGQELRIQDNTLPAAVEIHFSLQQAGGESVSRIGISKDGVTTVPIPDSMLEANGTTNDYRIYVFVYPSDGASGETVKKIVLNVKSRPKPEAWSGSTETTEGAIMEAINQIAAGKADGLKYENSILRLLSGEAELARVTIAGGSGGSAREIELQKSDSAIQWRYVGDAEWTDLVALTDITGPKGDAGQDGAPGAAGSDGKDGITPHIGDNGNWYLGDTDTGKPSRGETGPAGSDGQDGAPGTDGADGQDGKSAYQYAKEGGYTGSEDDFKAKLAAEYAEPIYKVTMTADDIAPALEPGKRYDFPDMASLAYTLVAPANTSVAAIYWFIFGSPADAATTITHPEGVTVSGPTIAAGKRYEVSIADGLAIIKEWEAAE